MHKCRHFDISPISHSSTRLCARMNLLRKKRETHNRKCIWNTRLSSRDHWSNRTRMTNSTNTIYFKYLNSQCERRIAWTTRAMYNKIWRARKEWSEEIIQRKKWKQKTSDTSSTGDRLTQIECLNVYLMLIWSEYRIECEKLRKMLCFATWSKSERERRTKWEKLVKQNWTWFRHDDA